MSAVGTAGPGAQALTPPEVASVFSVWEMGWKESSTKRVTSKMPQTPAWLRALVLFCVSAHRTSGPEFI